MTANESPANLAGLTDPPTLDPKFLKGTYGFYGTGIVPAFSLGRSPLPPAWPRQTVALIGVSRFDGRGNTYTWTRINHDGAVKPDQSTVLPSRPNGNYYVLTPYSGRIVDGSSGTSFDYVAVDRGRELYLVQVAPSYLPDIPPPTGSPTPPFPVGGTVLIIAKLISNP